MRTTIDPEAAIASARAQIRAVDKDLALTEVATLRDVVDLSMADVRFRTALLSAFAGIALLLAALGIYGVLAYFVSQRAREIGIRLALGASRFDIITLIVGQALMLTAIAVVIGVVATPLALQLVRGLLFGVGPFDPWTLGAVALALGLVSASAAAIPAWRAARANQLVPLRSA